MGRVIHSVTPAKQRTLACGLALAAIEQLEQESDGSVRRNDLLAFIILSLLEVNKTISQTASQWEKRGYWLKSEKFRAEWEWAELSIQALMAKKTTPQGWLTIPEEIYSVKNRLAEYKNRRKEVGTFWAGAFERLEELNKKSRTTR